MPTPPSILVIGCTGSGKASLARALARRYGAEIVSFDSMKVYRRMDIGTAKPPPDIVAQIPHHMIDVVEPSEEYSVAQFVEAAERAVADIRSRNRPVICVGGTALYIKSYLEGLFEGPGADPEIRDELISVARQEGSGALHERLRAVDPVTAQRLHPNDLRRIVRALEVYKLTGKPISELQQQWDRAHQRVDVKLFGIRREREDQNHRTNLRVKRIIERGLVQEVASLLREADPLSSTARKAVGYAEIIRHLSGELSLADAVELIKINTRQLAKSQRTWFKRFTDVTWLDATPESSVEQLSDSMSKELDTLWSV